MDSNKKAAIEAREFAKRKLSEKDFAGAKHLILEAKALFPELEGIPQVLTTLEVFIASEKKIDGEIDFYEVFGVNSSADEETIRKQYRKLALVLHPDKNKSNDAEEAFKVISEAWSLLSDKPKRLAYNQRRSSKCTQHKILTKSANGSENVSKRAGCSAKVAKNGTLVRPRTNTFWTTCHKCKMHYEYLRVYLNNTLLCPNCRKPFHASETPPPAIFLKKRNNLSTQQRNPTSSHRATNGTKNTSNFCKPNISLNQQRDQNPNHCILNGTKNTEVTKRDHEVALCNESLLKKMRVNHYGNTSKPNIISNFMQLDIGNLKVEKACLDVHKKLGEWHLESVTKADEEIKKKQNQKRKGKEIRSSVKRLKSRNSVSCSSGNVADDTKRIKDGNRTAGTECA